ncbi:retrotransposon protein, putative, ty1-copia subclass [Tanacetum coccineum]
MGYYFYYPPEHKIIVARYAEFSENNLISQKVSGSHVDLEIFQEEDMHPSKNTSNHHDEVENKSFELQCDVMSIPRCGKTHRAPDRLCLYINSNEHGLGDHGEPTKYKAALSYPDKWLEVMNAKMQSMKDNEVWVEVDLPPNAKTIGSKWLFKKNTNMDGNVHTYKAHLVAKGFTQTYNVDYEATFSLVADIKAIWILFAIVAFYGYEIWHMDVKITVLNGHLIEKAYMVQHEGNTKDMFLVYGGDLDGELRVTCYTDSGYETDADDIKSQKLYVFILNRGAVDCKSANQSTTAMSSTEAEYIVVLKGALEAI